ncbi:hypothetical protein CCP3SC15_920001 [Gammaproteobacteria bacterium]
MTPLLPCVYPPPVVVAPHGRPRFRSLEYTGAPAPIVRDAALFLCSHLPSMAVDCAGRPRGLPVPVCRSANPTQFTATFLPFRSGSGGSPNSHWSHTPMSSPSQGAIASNAPFFPKHFEGHSDDGITLTEIRQIADDDIVLSQSTIDKIFSNPPSVNQPSSKSIPKYCIQSAMERANESSIASYALACIGLEMISNRGCMSKGFPPGK